MIMKDESPVSFILRNGDRRTEDQQGRQVLADGAGEVSWDNLYITY